MQNGAILIPTRPQPDTVVAIFILKKFGEKRFPTIASAKVEVRAALEDGVTFESLTERGIVPLDVGKGPLDHHGSDYCVSELVARYLGVYNDPSLVQLIAYANRDDKQGKGTLSRDPIDRAFGISGLIAALNKKYPKDPNTVVEAMLPLLDAHHQSQQEHHVELPNELAGKKKSGEYEEFEVLHNGKKVLVACIISDKPAMPTFLRSLNGPRAAVVVQKSSATNHYSILTKQERKVSLAYVAGLIRLKEAEQSGIELANDNDYLTKTGRIDEIPYWYYDPATNSLLNGAAHNTETKESLISFEDMKKIVRSGLELSGQ